MDELVLNALGLDDLIRTTEFKGFWERIFEGKSVGKKQPFSFKFLDYKLRNLVLADCDFIGKIEDGYGNWPVNGKIVENKIKFRKYEASLGSSCPSDYEGEIERSEGGVYTVKGNWKMPYLRDNKGIFEMRSQ